MDKEQTIWFEDLYREMFPKLLIQAKATFGKNSMLAEEAVQDTFLVLCIKIDKVRSHENYKAWLLNTLRKNSANIRRSCDRVNRLVVYFMEQDKSGYIVNQEQMETDLMYSDLIGDEDYQLIKLVYVYGCTMKEAAKQYGITLAACKKRVQRTREKMKKILEEIEKNNFSA